jgi:hypothetical protein
LNTQIVCEGLQVFEKIKTDNGFQWALVEDDQGQLLVPKTVYKEVKTSVQNAKALEEQYPACFHYQGGLLVRANFPESLGDMKTAEAAMMKMREIQGPDNSPTAIVGGMRGFSGLTDDFGKRIQLTLAATLSMWMIGRSVDIKLTTTGDCALLVSSLNYWRREIIAAKNPLFGQDFEKFPDYKLIVPKEGELYNVDTRLHGFVEEEYREDTVKIYFRDASLPTSSEKGKKPDWDVESMKLLPGPVLRSDYIAFSPIYGIVPFPKDEKCQKVRKNAMANLKFWTRKIARGPDLVEEEVTVHVYTYGTAAKFQGIMSSFKDLHFVGWGAKWVPPKFVDKVEGEKVVKVKVPGNWDLTKEVLHSFPLESVKTQEAWFHLVSRDAKAQSFAWLYPIQRYSPISNLPYMSKTAVTIVQSQVEMEGGPLIPYLPNVKLARDRKLFVREAEQDSLLQTSSIGYVDPAMAGKKVFVPGDTSSSSSSSVVSTAEVSKELVFPSQVDPDAL